MLCARALLHQHSVTARKSYAECKTVQLVHESKTVIPRDRLLRLPDVEALSGLKKSTIYLLMKRGEFPRSVQVTPRCVAWPESRVLAFVQARIASSDATPLQRDVASTDGAATR